MIPPNRYARSYNLLTESVMKFIEEIDKQDLSNMATDKWTVKDELCHIAFWHDYYAQNYAAMASGKKPFLFVSKGGSTRNQEGVDKLQQRSKKYLITMLNNAQTSLYDSIVIKRVPEMTYIVGKEYKTEDFMEMIIGHINRHTTLLKRAKMINK